MSLDFLISNHKTFPYLMAITGLFTLYALLGPFSWQWWMVAALGYFLTFTCGISVMYHRKLTHRAYETKPWIEKLFSLLGAVSAQGSPLGWAMVHRVHHMHTDVLGDPHSPHVGSTLNYSVNKYDYNEGFKKWLVRDIFSSKFQVFIHKYYYAIIAAYLLVLAAISFELMLFFAIVPMFFCFVASAISVTTAHLHGYTNFDLNNHARNSWIHTLFAWGECWHNNHHKYPERWNFGVRWWEFDLGAQIVKLIKT